MKLYRSFVFKSRKGVITLGKQVQVETTFSCIRKTVAVDIAEPVYSESITTEVSIGGIKALEICGKTFQAYAKANGFRLRDVIYFTK